MSELYNPIIDETPVDEEEPEPKLDHWSHPTDSTLCWCGEPSDTPGYESKPTRPAETPESCPICAELMRRFGADWWWQTHRLYYESRCHSHQGWSFHNCVGAA